MSDSDIRDISGDWQGTLIDGKSYRIILKITRRDGNLEANLYSIDQEPEPTPVSSITLRGSDFRFTINSSPQCSYEGKVTTDGNSIVGRWEQLEPLPLNFDRATEETWLADPSPHTVRFVAVDNDVKLEVLDWGGSGKTLVLLAGSGNTAHIFDRFAPKLTAVYHVYGITRRGFGNSSKPSAIKENYSADRLGDDVVAVIDALKLDQPVLVGHSLGGQELSSIGTRCADKVAGLIYLDAAYSYAYYDPAQENYWIDLLDLQSQLERLLEEIFTRDEPEIIENLLSSAIPRFIDGLHSRQEELRQLPFPLSTSRLDPIHRALIAGTQKHMNIEAPILAIFAIPDDPKLRWYEARANNAANALERDYPSATVIRLQGADHYVFESNEEDVLQAMDSFISNLHRMDGN